MLTASGSPTHHARYLIQMGYLARRRRRRFRRGIASQLGRSRGSPLQIPSAGIGGGASWGAIAGVREWAATSDTPRKKDAASAPRTSVTIVTDELVRAAGRGYPSSSLSTTGFSPESGRLGRYSPPDRWHHSRCPDSPSARRCRRRGRNRDLHCHAGEARVSWSDPGGWKGTGGSLSGFGYRTRAVAQPA